MIKHIFIKGAEEIKEIQLPNKTFSIGEQVKINEVFYLITHITTSLDANPMIVIITIQ